MLLRCRRDYDAHTLWPKLGFEPLGEVEGRSRTGRKLTQWVRYLSPPPSLFDAETDGDGRTAAIDTNIFLDLTENRPSTDADALRSPAVAARVQMVVTAAVAAELDRHPNESVRATSRAALLNFRVARTPADAIDRAEQGLRHGLGRDGSPAGVHDVRHVAAAIACGADVFITRDHDLRTRLGRVAGKFGLEVLTPAQLVARIDEEHRHGVYRPADLAATDVTRQRVTARDLDEVVQRFLDHGAGETRSAFERHVRSAMATPARWELVSVRAEGRPITLFACGVAPDVAGEIAVARCSNDVLGRTVLVHLVAEYRRRAASDPPTLLTVTDTVRPHVRASLEAEGLEGSAGRLSAVCGLGLHEPAHLARRNLGAGEGFPSSHIHPLTIPIPIPRRVLRRLHIQVFSVVHGLRRE